MFGSVEFKSWALENESGNIKKVQSLGLCRESFIHTILCQWAVNGGSQTVFMVWLTDIYK